jgi:hypothetical protein
MMGNIVNIDQSSHLFRGEARLFQHLFAHGESQGRMASFHEHGCLTCRDSPCKANVIRGARRASILREVLSVRLAEHGQVIRE